MRNKMLLSTVAVLSVALCSLISLSIAQDAPTDSNDKQEVKIVESVVAPPAEQAELRAEIEALRKRLDEMETRQHGGSDTAPHVIIKRLAAPTRSKSAKHKLTEAQKKAVESAVKKAMEGLKKIAPALKEIDGILPNMDMLMEHLGTLNLEGIGDASEFSFQGLPGDGLRKEFKIVAPKGSDLSTTHKVQRRIIINGQEMKDSLFSGDLMKMSGLSASLESMMKQLEIRLQHLEKMLNQKVSDRHMDDEQNIEVQVEEKHN